MNVEELQPEDATSPITTVEKRYYDLHSRFYASCHANWSILFCICYSRLSSSNEAVRSNSGRNSTTVSSFCDIHMTSFTFIRCTL